MIAGVYKITNIKNGKFYIGSSGYIERRWKQHKHDLIHAVHNSDRFQEDFVNYDLKDYIHEILEEYPNYTPKDKCKLQDREQYYLDLYKDTGLLLNNSVTARGYSKDCTLSEEKQKEICENRSKWREQLKLKYGYEYIPKPKKEVFVYDKNKMIDHFDSMADCSKWLLDNNLIETKSKTPIISISGCIKYAIKQNKPYCGFIFSYEPLNL